MFRLRSSNYGSLTLRYSNKPKFLILYLNLSCVKWDVQQTLRNGGTIPLRNFDYTKTALLRTCMHHLSILVYQERRYI